MFTNCDLGQFTELLGASGSSELVLLTKSLCNSTLLSASMELTSLCPSFEVYGIPFFNPLFLYMSCFLIAECLGCLYEKNCKELKDSKDYIPRVQI